MHVKLFETAFHEHILIERPHYHLKQTCENKMLLKWRLNTLDKLEKMLKT